MSICHLAAAALSVLLAACFQARAATLCTAAFPNTTSLPEATPTSAFVNNNDGTVTHSLTGLMWKQCVQGSSGAGCSTGIGTTPTWVAALAAAVADTTAGHHDWRLPNRKELESIVESCGYAPAINQTIFPGTLTAFFWSGTSSATGPTYTWGVHFSNGGSTVSDKTGTGYVRLVRGGQPFDSFDAQQANPTLDIDGNGTADALTDGLLALRYLFGLRGTTLIQGAVGGGATRTTATQIEDYILTLLP